MPKYFTNAENGPAQLTGLSTGSWSEDIDLTADASYVGSAPTIPIGATGIILRFANEADAVEYAIGCRKPGSTRNIITDLDAIADTAQTESHCGTVSQTIDIYIESTNISVYVIGYFESEATLFDDVDIDTYNPASTSTWHDIDISASISSGTVFAIIETVGARNDGLAFRHPDGSDDRTSFTPRMQTHSWFLVPVDASRNIAVWSESTSTDIIVVGEITSNATSRTSGGDVSISTVGSYATVDFSSLSPPANAVIAIVEVINKNTGGSRKFAVRPFNDTDIYTDIYADITAGAELFFMFPMLDSDGSSNERCEAKIAIITLDFYVWGWITEDSTQLPINEISQGQAIDNIDLIQQHILSINPINQAQSIDNIILQAGITLSINGIDQSQAIENIDIIQANVLSIDELNQAQTLDNITLSLSVLLQIADIAQAQNIDILNLIQQNVLSINGIDQAQEIENIDIVQANLLSIDPIDQNQTLDNLVLETGVLLQIAGIAQSQIIDNIDLIQQNILSILDIDQPQSLETLNLTQANILAIADMTQQQIIDNIVLSITRIEGKISLTFVLTSPGITRTLTSPGANFTGE